MLIQGQHKRMSSRFIGISLVLLAIVAIGCVISIFYFHPSRVKYPSLTFSKALTKPSIIQNGGFYENPVVVFLHADDPNVIIYYTLDGTVPGLSSMIYKHPIIVYNEESTGDDLSQIPTSPRWKPPIGKVPGAAILRAIAVDKNNNRSAELVRTFFIGRKQPSLPVIALTVNPKDFFGYKSGIYVLGKSYGDKDNYARKNVSLDLPWWEYPSNYLSRGDNSERKIHIELFDNNGNPGFNEDAGARINGNATRGYAQKSLRICFREKYGNAALTYDLFDEKQQHTYNTFLLRNSGNDWDKTMFRDGLMQSLMKNSHVDIQKNRDAIVYLNGEYWGIHNIRERFDEHYVANKYHIPVDSFAILELNGIVSYGKKNDPDEFKDLLSFVKTHDLSNAQDYAYVCSKIDVQSFTDFLIANIYFCNSDWPSNNVKFWHYKAAQNVETPNPRDGRWRWMLYDMDWGFGYNSMSTPDANLLQRAKTVGSVGVLFSALIKNKAFTTQFIDRYKHFMTTEFAPDHLLHKIDSAQTAMKPVIRDHINRWRVIGTYKDWRNNVDVMRDFARRRRAFQVQQLNDFFGLKGSDAIIL